MADWKLRPQPTKELPIVLTVNQPEVRHRLFLCCRHPKPFASAPRREFARSILWQVTIPTKPR
eukprot:4377447-Amphidinium_carterae.1